jgi:hypothetical protein
MATNSSKPNPFVPAVKEKVKLRLSISGPSGSGKTYSALELATKLAALEDGKVAVIDTEGRSARRYADIFDFDVYDMEGNYSPKKFIEAIRLAHEHGYTVLVIDSLSHPWNGAAGWIAGRPAQQALVEAILHSQVHLICTMRSKTEWVIETGANGKAKVRKAGVGVVQSNDLEYEFDVAVQLDQQHTMNISKSRCIPLNEIGDTFTDTSQVTEIIHAWITDGVVAPPRQIKPASQPTTMTTGKAGKNGSKPEWTKDRIDKLFAYWFRDVNLATVQTQSEGRPAGGNRRTDICNHNLRLGALRR